MEKNSKVGFTRIVRKTNADVVKKKVSRIDPLSMLDTFRLIRAKRPQLRHIQLPE